jgi:hypothetical protein
VLDKLNKNETAGCWGKLMKTHQSLHVCSHAHILITYESKTINGMKEILKI